MLLLSLVAAFCISLGGGLLLAGQVSPRQDDPIGRETLMAADPESAAGDHLGREPRADEPTYRIYIYTAPLRIDPDAVMRMAEDGA